MNIIVLCGGLSAERDVSLSTGVKAAIALKSKGHNVVLIDSFFGYQGKYENAEDVFSEKYEIKEVAVGENAPDLKTLLQSRKQGNDSRIGDNLIEVCRAADIVFMALHGTDGEDGRIQAAFDLTGIKYTGTGSFGSGLAMNKNIAKKLLLQNGILTPKSILVDKTDKEVKDVGFPCVVKPTNGGSSIGTSIVTSKEGYASALALAFQYDSSAVVEQYIKGRECDVGVISGKALPVIEICPKTGFYDYKNKYQVGLVDEICPADLSTEVTEKLQKAAEQVFQALCFEVYGRMDFILDESNEIWCLEGNTLPGLTNTSLLPQEAQAAGISYEDLCELIVTESLKKYRS